MSIAPVLALPSKGRLKESAETYLTHQLGLTISGQSERGYTAQLHAGDQTHDMVYLQARDIAESLIKGQLAFGITGIDLLRESGGKQEEDYEVLFPLGFGHADLIVAVPDGWVDVRSMSDLSEVAQDFFHRRGRRLRVATKYHRLTREFFLHHQVHEFRIVDSSGATEAAPYAGQAELIVDITSTGATLRANDLRIIDDGQILSSQAVLVSSLRRRHSASEYRLQELFLAMQQAQAHAKNCVLIHVALGKLPSKLREQLTKSSIMHVSDQGRFVVPAQHLSGLVASGLFAEGHAVTISPITYANP